MSHVSRRWALAAQGRTRLTQLRITPLHPSLGAEVAGLDLAGPIDEPTRRALSRALADHLALVFHDRSRRPAGGPAS